MACYGDSFTFILQDSYFSAMQIKEAIEHYYGPLFAHRIQLPLLIF
jgi:hypothetical protein